MQERKSQVGVLNKAMAILQVFSREEPMLTAREIAARTLLSLPTAYQHADEREYRTACEAT